MSNTSPPHSLRERLRALLSRIWLRLLAFNLLLVFLPLAAVFTLATYERQLLVRQERSMVQQGRLLAAALGGQGELTQDSARALLRRLQGRTRARLRVLDDQGRLLSDTSILGPDSADADLDGVAEEDLGPDPQESWLYRIGALPFRLIGRFKPRPPVGEADFYANQTLYQGSEIAKALGGEYGSATRYTGGQRSMTLYSAIPVRSDLDIVGVALVSQSTYQILRDLYEVRLSIFKIFLASLGVALVLGLMVSKTIVQPLEELRRETFSLLDAKGRLRGLFRSSRRPDEIGDLSRDLRELARRLKEQQEFSQSFAADLSHEFKNPLASIRTATEVLAVLDDQQERQRFLKMIERDTARLEHLLSTVRELASIDAGSDSDESETIALAPLTRSLVEGWSQRQRQRPEREAHPVELNTNGLPLHVHASPERLGQIVDNLLDNAASFSPPEAPIEVSVDAAGRDAVIRVQDHGPGIPQQHLERVFDRFFSYRPEAPRAEDDHSGLGLAIVKAIAESYGGRVAAARGREGGAVFEIYLPRVAAEEPPLAR